jgi:DNA-binding transcriptional LysR family regulator
MDGSQIDWNLVPVLDALLSERNVSRAARRLGISQPTASRALARLRRMFDDDLLVRRGNAYELTARAEILAPMAREAVSATRTIVEHSPELEVRELARTFTVAASDYTQAVLMPTLRDVIALHAPLVTVEFVQPFAVASSDGEVLAQVDGWISPRELFADRPHVGSLADEWACVTADDHPAIDDGLRLEDLGRYRWVLPTVTGRRLILQLGGLRAHGVEAEVALTTDSFVSVPFLVKDSQLIGLMQRRLALQLAENARIAVHQCPWTVPPIDFTCWYDESRELDPAHRWFRELVAECMAMVVAE